MGGRKQRFPIDELAVVDHHGDALGVFDAVDRRRVQDDEVRLVAWPNPEGAPEESPRFGRGRCKRLPGREPGR